MFHKTIREEINRMHLHIFNIQLFSIRLTGEKILKTIKEIIINLRSFNVCFFHNFFVFVLIFHSD